MKVFFSLHLFSVKAWFVFKKSLSLIVSISTIDIFTIDIFTKEKSIIINQGIRDSGLKLKVVRKLLVLYMSCYFFSITYSLHNGLLVCSKRRSHFFIAGVSTSLLIFLIPSSRLLNIEETNPIFTASTENL